MELDKIRTMSSDELKGEEVRVAEQLFRIRFAKSLGKQEGVGKIRGLKKDVARLKTVAREQLLAEAKTASRSATPANTPAGAGKE